MRDEALNDYDGNKVSENKDWIYHELVCEAKDLQSRYSHMFENVNYQLS
jgi:hypothetical protein